MNVSHRVLLRVLFYLLYMQIWISWEGEGDPEKYVWIPVNIILVMK